MSEILKKTTYQRMCEKINHKMHDNKTVKILERPDSFSVTVMIIGQEHFTLYAKVHDGPRVEIWLRNTMASTQYTTIFRKYVSIESNIEKICEEIAQVLSILSTNDDVITKRKLQ